jgi:hydrogenase maturation protein HypF
VTAVRADAARHRIRLRGVVQGVGFRPHVYAVAQRHGVSGFVLNDADGVLVEAEGAADALAAFERALVDQAPPLAVVEDVSVDVVEFRGDAVFVIAPSPPGAVRTTLVSPDVCTCEACLAEIADPSARRYRYPFTNCTNCGPRFTITRDVPYDRPQTTMAPFPMCEDCRSEYEDPSDRRFHAQPVACPACGPAVSVADGDGRPMRGDAIGMATQLIGAGKIVAVKGLGGYHLMCDARSEPAVAALRSRKHREEKPFALMAPDLATVSEICLLDAGDERVLTSMRRPIVLLRRRDDASVAPSVAPGNRHLGVMLPYTPLHTLLVDRLVVATSGNVSDEPIAYRDDDARARLSGIADAFLTHDREIHVRCDDSVVSVRGGTEYPIRRSRGYAPEPVRLARPLPVPVLAVGAELKHTFCVAKDDHAFVSHHIGDLENWETMRSFVEGVEHFTRIFDVVPAVVAHDLHPEYLSTKWALESELPALPVQHHHAHIASCLADNRREERVIGLALDGTGMGADGTLWGFEILEADLSSYERAGHLREVPLPGGAAAIREPWRMGAVYLDAAFGGDVPVLPFVERTRERWAPVLRMARTGLNAPAASSAGRLFDAMAAVGGLRDEVTYEGQAAIELEQAADPGDHGGYRAPVGDDVVVDGVALVADAAADLAHGTPLAVVAARFHDGVAAALAACADAVRARTGLTVCALSGGTFQNILLLDATTRRLEARGFEVLVHRRVPCNDGGISLGQTVIAGAHRL